MFKAIESYHKIAKFTFKLKIVMEWHSLIALIIKRAENYMLKNSMLCVDFVALEVLMSYQNIFLSFYTNEG